MVVLKRVGVVRFTVEGWHRWEDAPPHRDYLAHNHRHLFHVEASVPLLHNEREVEFHDLLDFCKSVFNGTGLNGDSCETMAEKLAKKIAERFVRSACVSVFEDGEVGAIVEVSQQSPRADR